VEKIMWRVTWVRYSSVVLTTIALVACGGSHPAFPTITVIAPPAPHGDTASCGTVEMQDVLPRDPTAAQVAEDCFWGAYRQCAPTGMPLLAVRSTHREPVNEFVTTNTFALNNAEGRCAIVTQGGVQHNGLNDAGTPFAAVGSYPFRPVRCSDMTRDADGTLHITGCASGVDYTIPRP